jgi:hypothetical protein
MKYIVVYVLIICTAFCTSLEAQKPAISLLPQGHQMLQEILNDTSTRPDTLVVLPETPAITPKERTTEDKKASHRDSSIRKPQDRKKEKSRRLVLYPLRSSIHIIGFILITALNI